MQIHCSIDGFVNSYPVHCDYSDLSCSTCGCYMALKLAAHWISVNKALHAMHWIVIVGVHIHPFNSGSLLDGIVQSDYSVCIYSHSRDGNQSLRQNKI